jgi:hypothetical protein
MELNENIQVVKKATAIEFAQQTIVKHAEGTKAILVFIIKFENAANETLEIIKEGQEFNEFWENFTSSQYLFQLAIDTIGIQGIEVPENMDDSILNYIGAVIDEVNDEVIEEVNE